MKSPEPTVAAVVRQQTGVAWSRARGLCTEGRVTVNGERCLDPAFRVSPGTVVAVERGAPKLRTGPLAESAIVSYDWDVVIVDKPAGMLSVADDDGRDTGRMALLYAMALLPISLLPTLLGVTGAWYFLGALVLGIGYVAAGTGLLIGATPGRAWRLFFVSIVYLPALLTLMVLDKVAA